MEPRFWHPDAAHKDMKADPIAIVGIGCRFPGGAKDPASFWRMLCAGVDAVTEIPPGRWNIESYYDPAPGRPGKTNSRWGGFVEDIASFDPAFFSISPREAESMDPQQRLLLQTAWEAMEDAGHVLPEGSPSPVGVFVGISTNDYSMLQSTIHDFSAIDILTTSGGVSSIAANRLSYCFNLSGPSVAVDTACSSSLVALHLACRSLNSGECRAALVGGVNALLGATTFISFSRMSMLSPDGRCKAFDAAANGFVRGEGAGVVFLKPLRDARRDGDPIYAVIRATAMNQDAHTSSLTVPSLAAQKALIAEACGRARVEPRRIRYVEAHGPGTAVGDPVEARALGETLGVGRPADDPCLIGSVKTNIGHLEAGAGIAGLIKLALMLKHGQIPPNLHFHDPNPRIDFTRLKVHVPTKLRPFPHPEEGLWAGINSFGFGGTNAHAVLEGPPRARCVSAQKRKSGKPALLVLSARGTAALRDTAKAYRDFLSDGGEGSGYALDGICFTAGARRTHHRHRLAVASAGRRELVAALDGFLKEEIRPGVHAGSPAEGEHPKPVFVFAGQGPQWWGMGRGLMAREPVFLRAIEECDRLFGELGPWSLLDELRRDEASSRMSNTAIAQPAIFALQMALTALWKSWGIEPAAVVGHSVGEAAAACASGILTLPEAAYAIYERGRCMEDLGGQGRMLAADLDREEALRLIAPHTGRVWLAAVNGPRSVTLSGDAEALDVLAGRMEKLELSGRFLQVRHAFHSGHMDPVRDMFLSVLRELTPHPPVIPAFSTVRGSEAQAGDFGRAYWWDNIRRTVLFGPAIEALIDHGHRIFLEVGPHPALSGYIRQCLEKRAVPGTVLASLRRDQNDRLSLLSALGALHAEGCRTDWEGVFPGAKPVHLPAYAWQQADYWREAQGCREVRLNPPAHPLLELRLQAAQPTWQTWLNRNVPPYLEDHRLQGRVVMPAAAYVEMALGAARALSGPAPFALEELDFHKVLAFPENEESLCLQLSCLPQESSFSISSRAAQPGAEWVTHSTGTFRPLRGSLPPPVDLDEIKKRCPGETSPNAIYKSFEEAGLAYGPFFKGIRAAWRGQGEAFGRVEIPDALEFRNHSYIIHPALLDACLQVLSAALSDDLEEKSLALPVRVERLRCYADPVRPLWCRAHLVRRSEEALVGDITLFDEAGAVLMEIEGFHCRSAAAPGKGLAAGDGLYETAWIPRPLSVTPRAPLAISSKALFAEIGARMSRTKNSRQGRSRTGKNARNVLSDLDGLSLLYLCDAFHSVHGELRLGRRFQDRSFSNGSGSAAGRMEIAEKLTRILAENGILARRGQEWVVRRARPSRDTEGRWRDALRRHPSSYPALAVLRRVGSRLPALWRGEISPRSGEVFAEAPALAEHVLQDSWIFRDRHLATAEAVTAAVERMGPARMLRILEIGAGPGGLTSYLLPRLPSERTEYFFTDRSDGCFARAEQKFFDFPFVRYRTLDPGKPLEEQGFEPRSFDIVIAPDPRTERGDIQPALGRLRSLLVGGGLLVTPHSERPGPWAGLAFGILEDWPHFSSRAWPAGVSARGRGRLDSIAEEAGFLDAADIPMSGRRSPEAAGLKHSVFLAQSAADGVRDPAREKTDESAPTAWVVFSAGDGPASGLARRLRDHGDRVVLVNPGTGYRSNGPDHYEMRAGEPADMDRLMKDLETGVCAPPVRFVHGWSISFESGAEADISRLERAEKLGCLSVLHLVQALARRRPSEPAMLWLVTNGAQPALPGQRISVEQSPLWGLGRVLANEQRSIRCRLIDLSPDPTEADERALLEEVLSASDEDEVALRDGERLAARLVKTAAGRARMGEFSGLKRRPFRLDAGGAGTLDRLAFRAMPTRKPGRGEVEVEIEAAALNFRDVLKALRLYPSETDEDRLLGDECAGWVTAVGEGVRELRAGIEAVVLSPGCFASRLTVPAERVTPKPRGLTLEEAVTVPVAFLTADYALNHIGRLRRGERVLIQAASGGVGLAAVQIAQIAGAEVFASAGNPEKRDLLRGWGVPHVLDSRSPAFADDIRRLTAGRGVDVVLNSLAGEAIAQGLSILAPYGRFLEIGKRDIYQNSRIGLRPLRNNAAFHAIDLAQVVRDRPDWVALRLKRLRDLLEKGLLRPLPHRVFPSDQIAAAFREMAQARHVGKIVVSMTSGRVKPLPAKEPRLRLRSSGASYLVAGGLSGFGLAAAEWLARNGARHLVLIGRRGASSDEAKAGIARLRRLGTGVSVWKVDIADRGQVSQAFRRIKRSLPPLRGIVQAAAVYDDGLVMSLDAKRLKRVMEPKVQGTWNLHELSLDCRLDFFVMFSSVSSLVGNPGQGNYAAANAFMDALAHYRRAAGLSALTVNWGLIGDTGFAARQKGVQEHLAGLGLSAIPPARAMDALSLLLEGNAVQVCVADIDWSKWAAASLTRPSPRYEDLAARGSRDEAAEGWDIREWILSAAPDRRAGLVSRHIREQAAQVIRLNADKVDVDRPLADLGLDSLMAVELGLRLEKQFGISLPPGRFTAATTVAGMAASILEMLTGAAPGANEGAAGASSPTARGRADGCLVPLREGGPRLPLVCFHPAYGLVTIYQNLMKRLPKDLPLYGIQSPEMNGGSDGYESLESMAEDYAALLDRRFPRGPFRLFGFSFGGFLALTAAHALERRSRRVALVGLADSRLEWVDRRTSKAALLGRHIAEMYELFSRELRVLRPMDATAVGRQIEKLASSLRTLTGRERVQHVLSWIVEQKLLNDGIDLKRLNDYITVYVRHMSFLEGFRPQKIKAPLVCWSQGSNPAIPARSETGWKVLTAASATVRCLTGRHFDLMQPPLVEVLAEQLNEALCESGESDGGPAAGDA